MNDFNTLLGIGLVGQSPAAGHSSELVRRAARIDRAAHALRTLDVPVKLAKRPHAVERAGFGVPRTEGMSQP